jgi:hypothetical protein
MTKTPPPLTLLALRAQPAEDDLKNGKTSYAS